MRRGQRLVAVEKLEAAGRFGLRRTAGGNGRVIPDAASLSEDCHPKAFDRKVGVQEFGREKFGIFGVWCFQSLSYLICHINVCHTKE